MEYFRNISSILLCYITVDKAKLKKTFWKNNFKKNAFKIDTIGLPFWMV